MISICIWTIYQKASNIGCTEQCPFCKEQCDYIDPDHSVSHSVSVHRSGGIKGIKHHKSRKLSTEVCQVKVAGDWTFRNAVTGTEFEPYKDYQKFYPKWSIPPDVTAESSLYWKLFMSKFKKNLASRYKAVVPDVPNQWGDEIEWSEVALNLKTIYKL